jgi:hypothetical protein
MEALLNTKRTALKQRVDELLESLPAKSSTISETIKASFPPSGAFSKLLQARIAEFERKVQAGEVCTAQDLDQLASIVQSEAIDASFVFEDVSQWIQLNLPRCETGNNFGVEVQEVVLKVTKEAKGHMSSLAGQIPDFQFKRAENLSKIHGDKTSEQENATVNEALTKEGATNNETKNISKTGSKQTNKLSLAQASYISYLASFDVDWLFRLKMMLEEVIASYMRVCDAVIKHKDLILKPRSGFSSHGHSPF